jgi:hypothetical protein
VKGLDDEKVKIETRRRIESVRADSPRRWGQMTANGMVCHLADAFRGVWGEIYAAPYGNIFHRTLMKWLFFMLPRIPVRNYPTSPEIAQEIGGTQPTEFERDKRILLALFDSFAGDDWDEKNLVHPTMGKLTRHQWHRWAYMHIDHHLRQFGH